MCIAIKRTIHAYSIVPSYQNNKHLEKLTSATAQSIQGLIGRDEAELNYLLTSNSAVLLFSARFKSV
jgi:hypothetical protein